VSEKSDVLAWLNDEQKKPERWVRPESGVLRFMLTGPELQRMRNVLTAVSDSAAPAPPAIRALIEKWRAQSAELKGGQAFYYTKLHADELEQALKVIE
jgi:hypothetical protein